MLDAIGVGIAGANETCVTIPEKALAAPQASRCGSLDTALIYGYLSSD